MTRLQTSLLGQRTTPSRTSSGDLILSGYLGVDDEIVERTSGAIIEHFARALYAAKKKTCVLYVYIKLFEIDIISMLYLFYDVFKEIFIKEIMVFHTAKKIF